MCQWKILSRNDGDFTLIDVGWQAANENLPRESFIILIACYETNTAKLALKIRFLLLFVFFLLEVGKSANSASESFPVKNGDFPILERNIHEKFSNHQACKYLFYGQSYDLWLASYRLQNHYDC